MNNSTLTTSQRSAEEIFANFLIEGDLAKLSPRDRVLYYNAVCHSLGLNSLTKPFDLIRLNGRLVLYARKDATDQLRKIYQVSLDEPKTSLHDDTFVTTITARTPDGRVDTDMGAVSLKGLTGDALSNAMMKCLTKAKRRVTLSICGLGMLDASEVESIPEARQQVELPNLSGEAWRKWKFPADAIDWACTILPSTPRERLEEMFAQLPAVRGKKAQAWASYIADLAAE